VKQSLNATADLHELLQLVYTCVHSLLHALLLTFMGLSIASVDLFKSGGKTAIREASYSILDML